MTLEIVAQSADDALTAERAGADRIELVSALSLGGLTPSIGTLEATLEASRLPIMAMLRPRSGGFVYSPGEAAAMRNDGRRFLEAGARGLVFGILDNQRGIDEKANADLVELGGEAAFHRAFDALEDPFASLERLIALGFQRILTSGGGGTALEGKETLRKLVQQAAGRIEILPGGGVRSTNAVEILRHTGATQLHLAALEWAVDGSSAGMSFNGPAHPEDQFGRVDPRIVAAMRQAV